MRRNIRQRFFGKAGTQICYTSWTLTFRTGSSKVIKTLAPINAECRTPRIRILALSRTELVVKLPVKRGMNFRECIRKKQEIQKDVYLAGATAEVRAGYAITSIAQTY